MKQPGPDFDAIWKETLMGFFPESLEWFDSALAGAVDRSRKVRFLDKELRETLGSSPRPRQHVDLLAEVLVEDPDRDGVLIQMEVQRSKVPRFEYRMLFCHSALVRRFGRPVISLAILADPDPKWRPTGLKSGIAGVGTRFEFPICKLADFTDVELESNPNPVSLVILAERVTRRHRNDPVARREAKLALFRRMTELLESKRYGEEQRLVLTRVMDGSIPLPEAEERLFLEQFRQSEGDIPMTYLTTFERQARREGLEQGLEQGLERGRQDGVRLGWEEALKALVSARFPDWKPSWNRYLENIDDANRLRQWHRLVITAPSGVAFLRSIGKRPR